MKRGMGKAFIETEELWVAYFWVVKGVAAESSCANYARTMGRRLCQNSLCVGRDFYLSMFRNACRCLGMPCRCLGMHVDI